MPRILLTALIALALAPALARADEFKPDIDVHAPYGLQQTTNGGRTFVAFDSFVENVGAGPLKLLGQRSGTGTPLMDVTQVLLDSNAVTTGTVERTVPAGQMQFSTGGGHDHWHYLRFEDYMLLSVPNLDFVAPTRKTGFCLVGLDLSFSCGGGQPGLTQIGDPAEAAAGSGPFPNTRAMGMIIGGGPDAGPNRSSSDHYGPSVEGQDVEITGVPDGRYCLSFVVDPAGNIVEGSKANNGASRLVDLGSDSYGRTVAEGAAFPDSATCGLTDPALPADPSGATTTPAPAGGTGPAGAPGGRPGTARRPPAVTDVAARLSSSALHRSFRGVAGLSRRCRPTALDSATCTVAFRQARVRYRGTVSLKQKPVAGEWRWYYRIDVRPTRGHARPVRTKTLFGGVVGVDAAAARRIARLPRGVAVPERRGAAPDDAFVCRLR